jgi:hypothetical protein
VAIESEPDIQQPLLAVCDPSPAVETVVQVRASSSRTFRVRTAVLVSDKFIIRVCKKGSFRTWSRNSRAQGAEGVDDQVSG